MDHETDDWVNDFRAEGRIPEADRARRDLEAAGLNEQTREELKLALLIQGPE
jgi:hypothetical protein